MQFNKEQELEIYKQAIKVWGNVIQIIKFMEESSELQKELTKLLIHLSHTSSYTNKLSDFDIAEEVLDYPFENLEDDKFNVIIDEIVDVDIVMNQLKVLFGEKRIEDHKQIKLNKLSNRLKEINNERSI